MCHSKDATEDLEMKKKQNEEFISYFDNNFIHNHFRI